MSTFSNLTPAEVERRNREVLERHIAYAAGESREARIARLGAENKAKLRAQEKHGEVVWGIVQRARARGWYPMPARQDRANGWHPGAADVPIMVEGGRMLWIEVKVGKDKQRPEQRDFEAECRRRGHPYHVVASVEEFEEVVG